MLAKNTREVNVNRLSFIDCKDWKLLFMLVGTWRQMVWSCACWQKLGGKDVSRVSNDWETQEKEIATCLVEIKEMLTIVQ